MKRRKGFTLIELTVAVGLLAVVLMIGSTIFRVSIDSQRLAIANMEVMQKFRAITDQLDADFEGLRKDGEIYAVWVAFPDANQPGGYARADRIMFFTEGDFQSYGTPGTASVPVHGNLARVCYLLARDENDTKPEAQSPRKRMLARTQHILTADSALDDLPSLADVSTWGDNDLQWVEWNDDKEYDKTSLQGWKNIDPNDKINMLSVITDVTVGSSAVNETLKGAKIDRRNPARIHMLLCEGVGQFEVQGWNDAQGRWVPQVDPDGDGSLADSDFFVTSGGIPDPVNVPGVLYPLPLGQLQINGSLAGYPRSQITQAHFNTIPGLGRALKFTFTIYDSKGVLKKGRTFTHIVQLDG